jgi:hypothetical protein
VIEKASTLSPYRFWPEPATAVAVRYLDAGELEISASFSLDDRFAAVIRPTRHFVGVGEKRVQIRDRVRRTEWLERWPLPRVELGQRQSLNS